MSSLDHVIYCAGMICGAVAIGASLIVLCGGGRG